MPAGAVGGKNVVRVRIFRVPAQVCKVAGLRVQLDWGRSRIFNRFNGYYKGEIINKIESTDRGVIEIRSLKFIKKTFFSSHGNKIFFYFLIIYTSLIFFLKKKGS